MKTATPATSPLAKQPTRKAAPQNAVELHFGTGFAADILQVLSLSGTKSNPVATYLRSPASCLSRTSADQPPSSRKLLA